MQYEGLRVAFLHPRLEGGGSERVSLTTARRLAQWGIRSYFIATKHNSREFVVPEGLEATIHCLPNTSSFCAPDNKEALRSYLEQEHIAVAFVCYLDGSFFSDRLRGSRCRFVYWCHANPFWEYLYDVERGQMQARYSLKRWIQWYLLGGRRSTSSREYRKAVLDRYRRDIDVFDRYIVLCPEYAHEISETLSLSPEARAKLLPMINTIDIVPNPPLEKKREIAFVSRIDLVQKRFDRMLLVWREVMNRLPDWTLKIYGSGHDEWIMHKIIKQLKLKRVEYCGYTTDLRQIYDNSSVVCLTSTFEGWPMVLAEAQSHGCLPVTFDSYEAASSIVGMHGEYGILVPSFDTKRYADELVAICSDEVRRAQLQSACLEKRLSYAEEVNDERWHQLFEELLREHP